MIAPNKRLLYSTLSVCAMGWLMSCAGGREDRTASTGGDASGVVHASYTAEKVPVQDQGNLIESRESTYNNVYVYRTGGNLCMTFGFNKSIYQESIYNPADDRELPVSYTQFMTASLMYPKRIKSILEIGSGGGRTSWYLHRFLPGAQVTSVELDPVVADLARKYFGIRNEPGYRTVTSDGRIFLANSKEQYDVILVDAYRGPFVPFHLLTREFYQIVREHLADGGVVAQNVEPSTLLFDSAVKTIHTAFAQVEFYDANYGNSSLTGKDVGGNVVTIAYQGEGLNASDVVRMANQRQSQYKLRYELQAMLAERYVLKPVVVNGQSYLDVFNSREEATGGIDDSAPILTDDFAPVDSLKAIEKHNRKWTTAAQ
ncbi:MAG TPA: fused MFS/spermidine synthase [Terriglobales bacterium]